MGNPRTRVLTRRRPDRKIREPPAIRTERDLPLSTADQRELDEWLAAIGRARLERLKKLERIVQLAASLPPELGDAAVISLAVSFRKVLGACRAGDQALLRQWSESIELAWEHGGGLLRAQDHPDVQIPTGRNHDDRAQPARSRVRGRR